MPQPLPEGSSAARAILARGALVRAVICAASAVLVVMVVAGATPASAVARWVPIVVGVALTAAAVRHAFAWWRLRQPLSDPCSSRNRHVAKRPNGSLNPATAARSSSSVLASVWAADAGWLWR